MDTGVWQLNKIRGDILATYTTLEDVKRILRTNGGERIRFSDSITSVLVEKPRMNTGAYDSNLDLIFNYRLIEIHPDYSGNYLLRLDFIDSTSFRAVETDFKTERELTLSVGTIGQDWESPDGMFLIPKECWDGIINAKDRVQIRFESHLSDTHAIAYIEDAETKIDAMMEENQIMFIDEENPLDKRIFKPGLVPDRIRVSASYLAAYYIFTNTFADTFREKDAMKFSYVGKWLERAESGIMEYIIGVGRRAPAVLAFPRFIDKIGDPEVGPGLSGASTDHRTVTRDAGVDNIFR